MSVDYRPGGFTDVCTLPDGRFARVVVNQNVATVYVDEVVFSTITAPENLLFCRAAYWNSQIVSIHQGNGSGSAYLLRNRTYESLGPTFGVQPVAIDGTYVYIVRNNQSYDRIALADGHVETLPHGAPGSSQGISDVEPDGTIRWADTSRSFFWAGVTFIYPNHRGDALVGQADPPQIAGGLSDGRLFTAIPGDGFEPHIARSGDRYAIVARTPQGAAYVEVPPYPVFINADTRPQVPTPPPTPKPAPIPEPIPVSYPLPQQVESIIDRYAAQYPVPQGSGPEDFDPATGGASSFFEDKCRVWTRKCAQTVKAITGEDYGVKNAGGGRPQSKDSLSRIIAGRLVNWDLLTGAGTGRPALVHEPQGEDITGQTFMPVEAVNWLSGTHAPDPGTTVPDPTQDLSAILKSIEDLRAEIARIVALEARVDKLEAHDVADAHSIEDIYRRVEAIEQKPAPKFRVEGGTGRTFGHAHSINVTLVPTE